jgi:hypothetical protein
MRLLRVQSQDLPGNLAFRDDQSGDGLSPKAAHGLEAMAAVRSPETTAWCHNSDDGVEKTPSLTNNVGEPFVVSVGEIALKWRWLNLVEGENREQGLMTAKRLLIEAHHAAPGLLNSFRGFRGRSF